MIIWNFFFSSGKDIRLFQAKKVKHHHGTAYRWITLPRTFDEGTKVMISCPPSRSRVDVKIEQGSCECFLQKGYTRILIDGGSLLLFEGPDRREEGSQRKIWGGWSNRVSVQKRRLRTIIQNCQTPYKTATFRRVGRCENYHSWSRNKKNFLRSIWAGWMIFEPPSCEFLLLQ